MNRRTFLQIGMTALGSIFIPGVMRGAWIMPQLPVGLGMGVNVEGSATALALALDVLQPGWFYHWRQWPPSNHPGFVPALQPCPGPGHPPYLQPAPVIEGFRLAMRQAGADLDAVPWIVGNEPEFSGWTPEQTAAAIAEQVRVLWDVGLTPNVIAPGSNITTPEHLVYLDAWRNAAARNGLAYTLAIHIYEHRTDMLDFAWRRFVTTLDHEEQVLVTECGAGANRTMDEWLSVMPWFYELASEPQVRALAPFSAYLRNVHGEYPGFMLHDGTLTPLGEQWVQIQR